MSDDLVLLDATRAGVAVVTLNRPEVHNAFNEPVIERLTDILDELRGADGVRIVFIEGAGKNFSAGADLEWMKAAAHYTHADNLEDAKELAHMLHLLHTLPQPTVALVDGAARGGGVGLVAACDMAIATERASFALSEVKLGLTPATISPYVLKALGERVMRRYALTGEVFSASEAQAMGLVTSVVADKADLATQAEAITGAVFQNGPHAVQATKKLLDLISSHPLDEGLRSQTAKIIADIRSTDEAKEGLNAFLEKRAANWVKAS